MKSSLSLDTQAILLLTAPLIVGRNQPSTDILTEGEFARLAQLLREHHRQPQELLAPSALEWLRECPPPLDTERVAHLLSRGFLLSQAMERWQTRAIWVVSGADAEYPQRLKTRLKHPPPILYGCGEAAILETGGLAVVGSRQTDEELIAYTEEIGRLTAQAQRTLVSGGARGIDQAAMRGALEAGGKTAGVLSDSLERAALTREHRSFLMDGQLVLISPYDPLAGFNVGHAMQRNKLIYALADAALVVNSDYEKGGTWAGAVEQLEKLRFVPVYVRSTGTRSTGLEALINKGALPWPDIETPEALAETLQAVPGETHQAQDMLPAPVSEEERFAKARELLGNLTAPKTDAEVAADLQVSKTQAKAWLQRLIQEGVIEKYAKPVRYGPKLQGSLLE